MQQPITYQSLMRLHLWQLQKRKSNWLLLIVFLLMGCFGLYQGYAVKQQQTNTITAFKHEKDSAFISIKKDFSADTSTINGKAAFEAASNIMASNWDIDLPVYKYPISTAIFNIGQSDVFTYYYNFKVQSFIMQLFKQTEISNPLRSLVGHFDVTFWVVYLLPLLALLLCFNTLSAETDSGNWKLVQSQGINAKEWLAAKFLMVGIIIGILLLFIGLSGCIINIACFKQSPNLRDFLFFLGAIIYICFWLSVLYFINAAGKDTGYNAMMSGLTWVCICLLLPTITSKIAEGLISVDNSVISTYSRRPQDTRIDADPAFAASLITTFAKQQPTYKLADTISKKPTFQTRVYNALHSILHQQRWPLVTHYYEAIEQRQQVTNNTIFINPASSMDGLFASLAANDAAANHHFIYQSLAFHQQMQNAIYPVLFLDKKFTKNDYDKLPTFSCQPAAVPFGIAINYALLLGLAVLIFIGSNKKLKRLGQA